MFSERSGVVNIGLEGMMLMGAFWGICGADKTGSWVVGLLSRCSSGGLLALCTRSSRSTCAPTRSSVGTAVNFLALGITGYFFFDLYHGSDVPTRRSRPIPTVSHPVRLGLAVPRRRRSATST